MAKVNAKRDPLVRVTKRNSVKKGQALLYRLIAVLLGLVLSCLFVLLTAKIDPVRTVGTILKGAFGNKNYLWITINATIKLLCISVALAPAFKMRFWNIGAEGQVLFGGLMAAIVMISLDGKPAYIVFPMMFVCAALGGALWGVIPAFFKSRWETNETLFTLMMNYIAMQLVDFYYNKWRGEKSSLGQINGTTHTGWFPKIFGQTTFINLVVVVLLVVFMYFYLEKTKQGYEISVVGDSLNTARYAGINVRAVMIRTMALSGLICGICGFLSVAGDGQTISSGLACGYGFTAIIVAWLAKFNTFYMAGISFFIIALEKGTGEIPNAFDTKFNASASQVVVGIMLFCIIGSEFFINYKLTLRKKDGKNSGRERDGKTKVLNKEAGR